MRIEVREAGVHVAPAALWPGFCLQALRPALTADGAELPLVGLTSSLDVDGDLTCICDFAGRLQMALSFAVFPHGVRVRGRLRNVSAAPVALGRLAWLESTPGGAVPAFGLAPEALVMLVQTFYRADIVPLFAAAKPQAASAVEPNAVGARPSLQEVASQHVWVVYDRQARRALLAGFLTNERWTGTVAVTPGADNTLARWSLGCDGGDLQMLPGQEFPLEEFLLLEGTDPLDLLDAFGAALAARYTLALPAPPPVSWCSWYSHRLSVSEERVLAEAAIAARRLRPLGLRIMEVDLGWEHRHLPSAYEENERFPHGLKGLGERLAALGFDLGCWTAPYQISEFDPVAHEHPEWLLPGSDGKPLSQGPWFWTPHGEVYFLDLTHPEAQAWLRQRIASLAERGVRYLKSDFIAQPKLSDATGRFNRHIAAGVETARIGARIIREALPEALILSCGGPEMPGTGHWPLEYTCMDTGNTGLIAWDFQRDNFRTVACHLWKNHRLAVLQPSCLCVGLPGTLEEARLRATVTFLTGGQVDISDTLATLPEDRWAVLEATLPPLGLTARAVDLFEPVFEPGTAEYEAQCRGNTAAKSSGRRHPPGSVWHLRVRRDWDEWDLVGVFAWDAEAVKQRSVRFRIPFERLGLDPKARYWAHEFWSGQFLGALPAQRRNADGYGHPGDMQDLAVSDDPGVLDIAFTGRAVKLLCLRAVRPHPWVVGTNFHQSCGAELADVRWDARRHELSGRLMRPAGHTGALTFVTAGRLPVSAEVDGAPVALIPVASGAWRLNATLRQDAAEWRVRFAEKPGSQP